MAKEIVTWCDPCLDLDMHSTGHEHEISIDGRKPVLIDMCNTCAEAWLGPLSELLEKHGQSRLPQRPFARPRTRSKEEGPGRVRCLYCEATYADELSGGLRHHMFERHGVKLSELNQGPCPICDFPAKRLGKHLSYSHPEHPTVSAAYAWARDNGDPFGHYAAAMKLEKIEVRKSA